jgi:hypothetical protein
MKESIEVRNAMLRFYDRLTAGDVPAFDSIVSDHPATVVMGTAPGERVVERHRLRFGFEAEGVGMTPGPIIAFADGDLGWILDEPVMSFPDGSRIATRLTAIFFRDDAAWRMVHMHISVGVPDDEVLGLQARWGTAP